MDGFRLAGEANIWDEYSAAESLPEPDGYASFGLKELVSKRKRRSP
jgi:hypothetical protein